MRDFLLSFGIDRWILLALLGWPLAAAALVRLLGQDRTAAQALNAEMSEVGAEATGSRFLDARVLTLGALLVESVLSIVLWLVVDPMEAGWQARIDLPWLPDLGARLSLGVDGLSLTMVLLTATVLPLSLLGAWKNVRVRTPTFGALLLLLTAGLMGVFVALDLLVFYLAWELMLIPTYLLIGIWGAAGQSQASARYVLFTLVGSLLMLVALIVLWSAGGGSSMHLDDLLRIPLTPRLQLLLFGAFFAAFAVKTALVPFHSWLPGAQAAAPTVVAVTLGLKVGVYAILRFAMPLFPAAVVHPTLRLVILIVSTIAVIYGAGLALAQRDLKRVIAYASVSHAGLIMLGCFVLTPESVQGAVMSMVSSGLATSTLLLLAGMLEDRRGTTDLGAFGGLAQQMPWFATSLVVAMLATAALPGTSGFVGEFPILMGTFASHPVLATIVTSGVVLSAAYGLRAVQRVIFEPLDKAANRSLADLGGRERVSMMVLVIGILAVGLYPAPIMRRVDGATKHIIEAVRFGPNAPAPLPPVSVRTTP